VKVKAEFPEHGVSIHGHLNATFREDGNEVIGELPAFRIVVQGHTQPHAEALLGKLFVEFCGVAVSDKRLWEFLIKLGFKIRNVAPEDDRNRRDTSNTLYILEAHPESGSYAPDQKQRAREVEFAGAGAGV
jgi:hypothetical protein